MAVSGILIIILIGIVLGCAIMYGIKKKDTEGNTSNQSQQFNQFQDQMPHGQQFQGQQSNKFCTNCGKQIEVEADFCPFCGVSQNTQ